MRPPLAWLMCALLLASCGGGKNETMKSDRPHLIGGYTQPRALTGEDRSLFDRAYRGDARLTPVSVSTQVVAGVNYSYVCRDSLDALHTVVIFVPLPGRGEPRVTAVEPPTPRP